MAKIIPAILEQTTEGFLARASSVVKLTGVESIQVDFGDGVFIENKLLPVAAIQTLNPAFNWEAHLMIKQPKDFLDYKICGFNTIIVHYEAFDNSRDLHEAIDSIKSLGLKAGLAVNPSTPVEVCADFGKIVSQFLIMGVLPGKQGQEFLPETIERVKTLRQLMHDAIIEVDGGVNALNVKSLAGAGADLLVAGSAIVKASNIQEAWQKLNIELTKS